MDPRQNPYSPGAGTPPPELAGRDDLIERTAVAIDRIRAGRAAKSCILYGLRGVGKTVLLNRIHLDAVAGGIAGVRIEAPEERSLPALLITALWMGLIRLSQGERMKGQLLRAMRALASFASAQKVNYGGIEFGIDFEPETGLADSGDLDMDLADLIASLGHAAKERHTAFALFIDELQYVPENQLASLIAALHNSCQMQLPIIVMAAGLPQLVSRTGKAKSYAERLFEFAPVGRLDDADARNALILPASREGVEFSPEAVSKILRETAGYPYFLQEWGKHSRDAASESPIGLGDTRRATDEALAELDASFFRVRFDRLTSCWVSH